jgi:hypothetical protein
MANIEDKTVKRFQELCDFLKRATSALEDISTALNRDSVASVARIEDGSFCKVCGPTDCRCDTDETLAYGVQLSSSMSVTLRKTSNPSGEKLRGFVKITMKEDGKMEMTDRNGNVTTYDLAAQGVFIVSVEADTIRVDGETGRAQIVEPNKPTEKFQIFYAGQESIVEASTHREAAQKFADQIPMSNWNVWEVAVYNRKGERQGFQLVPDDYKVWEVRPG